MDSSQLGHLGEELASQYLECVKGMRIIGKRVRFYRGEIDLIAEVPCGDSGDRFGGGLKKLGGGSACAELRFVEVKCRRSMNFGGVVEGMTALKLTRIWRAISQWRRVSGDMRKGSVWFLGLTWVGGVWRGGALGNDTWEIEEWEVG